MTLEFGQSTVFSFPECEKNKHLIVSPFFCSLVKSIKETIWHYPKGYGYLCEYDFELALPLSYLIAN